MVEGPGDDGDSPIEEIAVGVALIVAFGLAGVLYTLGVSAWWIAFPAIGGLVPLSVGLAKWYASGESEAESETATDPVDRLRSRYANGEITEAEFERRLERLLETETVEDARESIERGRGTRRGDPDREREPEEV